VSGFDNFYGVDGGKNVTFSAKPVHEIERGGKTDGNGTDKVTHNATLQSMHSMRGHKKEERKIRTRRKIELVRRYHWCGPVINKVS